MDRTTGYSGRPLAQKLGLQAGARVVALKAPRTYRSLLAPIPRGVSLTPRLSRSALFVHWFVHTRSELERGFARVASALADTGVLWISWPKKASGVATDVTEDVLRDVGLPYGLVDVKVCAVDNTWSALKFVRRLRERRS